MAKNTKTGRKPPKDPETPVCSYEGGIPPGKIRELCVCWNINTKSYSFKIDTCVKGDPNVAWLRNGWLSLKTELVNNNPNHVYKGLYQQEMVVLDYADFVDFEISLKPLECRQVD
jgi:hypothetical protein